MQESAQYLQLTKKAKTVAGCLKFELETKLLPVLAQNPNSDFAYKRIRHVASMLNPWPDWALRIASEIMVVYFPRIQRETIFAALKGIHWIFFEAEIEGDFNSSLQLKSDPQEFGSFPDFSRELVTFMAHVRKHTETFRGKMEATKAKAKVWTEQDEKALQQIKMCYEEMGNTFIKLLSGEPLENHLPLMESFVAAYKATCDGQGRFRETTATNVYKQILKSWPQIQNFSDVKQLCHFLDPILGHGDSEMKLDRVKKIVRRMGIEFCPNCQGTRQ